jgi:hypothetical protein
VRINTKNDVMFVSCVKEWVSNVQRFGSYDVMATYALGQLRAMSSFLSGDGFIPDGDVCAGQLRYYCKKKYFSYFFKYSSL